MDAAIPQKEAQNALRSSAPPSLAPQIEMEADQWHATGCPPFPELLSYPRSGWFALSRSDIRLVYHIISLSLDLHRRGLGACTPWAQNMPK